MRILFLSPRRSTLGWLMLLLAGWAQADTPAVAEPIRVLFLGNSLTYSNDLPATVRALAQADGVAMEVRMIARPNLALEDHWRIGPARRVVERGDWDYVVMQQGPSSLPANQRHLREWSLQWGELIRTAGARPALTMVWPAARHFRSFDAVDQAYANAAQAADALFLPAGRAWLEALRRDPDLKLYDDDGFHPSRIGTLLTAMVIYAGIRARAPSELPERIRVGPGSLHLNPQTRRVLLDAIGALMVPAAR